MNIEKIKKHLSDYKIRELGITESGTWWKNHKKYSHILPYECKFENVIKSNRKNDLINLIDSESLHLGFHHLNSSQALALNLFGPLVLTNNLKIIENLLLSEKSIGKFEYIENPKENTNFDFFVGDGNLNNYFEVKYTEKNFGNAKEDLEHKQKFQEIYKKELESFSDITEKEFYKKYQLWRNIIYAKKGNVFFIVPIFRKDLILEVETAKKRILDEKIKNRIFILEIDSLVKKCIEIDELKNHYIEFEKKYLNIT
ncbi:MAG: hypothetical protein IK002_09150 [Treponema sp.]|uniref:PGN_0703 family putative restriction endonuclease n=1 Tax=Treponema sp. TaxID=166 RepID=UPI00298DA730|nr:hypothetical protein [Treponema sp.]MBR5934138.1 hypothetical protein [Treponema sp.]